MNDILERGRALAQSARNLAFAGPELRSMLNAIWDQLVSEAVFKPNENAGDSQRWKGKWLRGAYGYNANILKKEIGSKIKKKSKPGNNVKGVISILVRLCGDPEEEYGEVNFPWNDQACLFIGWHNFEEHLNDRWDQGCSTLMA